MCRTEAQLPWSNCSRPAQSPGTEVKIKWLQLGAHLHGEHHHGVVQFGRKTFLATSETSYDEFDYFYFFLMRALKDRTSSE